MTQCSGRDFRVMDFTVFLEKKYHFLGQLVLGGFGG